MIKTGKFDLENRTEKFAITMVKFLKQIYENSISKNIISQLIRSSTSIGANYCEANNAVSRNDFKHKISICRKEAKETTFWIRVILAYISSDKTSDALLISQIKPLEKEAQELLWIFNAILNSINKKIKL